MAAQSIHIVGASLAGIRAAEALRRREFDGRIVLIGDEPHHPYDRPPLSKQVLAGEWEADRLALTKPEKFEDLGLDLRLGVRATSFDLASRTLSTDTGDDIVDGLVIATGARCRTLPGTEEMSGVHVLRSLDDALALRADLDAGPDRVVVVGAGFIGAEVAATCRGRGHAVTMVEPLPTPLGRVLGDDIGCVMAEVHVQHGVDLRTGVGADRLEADAGRVARVVLTDGTVLESDLVVIGIGVLPAAAGEAHLSRVVVQVIRALGQQHLQPLGTCHQRHQHGRRRERRDRPGHGVQIMVTHGCRARVGIRTVGVAQGPQGPENLVTHLKR